MTNRKLTILFLSHRIPYPANKGEKIRSFNQIKHLHNNGHLVHVCAPTESKEDIKYATDLEQFCTTARLLAKPGPLKLVYGLIKNLPLSVANFYCNQAQREFDRIISETNPDVIMCSASSMAEYIFNSTTLTSGSSIKLIMDFMDLDSDKWRQYKQLKSFPLKLIYSREEWLLLKYEKKIHRKFDSSLFIAQAEVDLFHKKDSNLGKVHVVANGLDNEFFKPALNKKTPTKPILLFTGVMDYLPNVNAVEWFVKNSWPNIKKNYPEAEFIIAGMNPNTKIKALTKYPGIEVTGFVEDIRDYYNKADFFVAPFQVARGVQNKVLQAFACGLPVIGSEAAFEGINCGEEHRITAETPEDFTNGIFTLLSSPEKQETLSRNSITLIREEYSWEGCLKKLDDLVNN